MIDLMWEMRRDLDWLYGETTIDPPPSDQFRSPLAGFLLVSLNGKAVGCGAIKPWDETTAEFKRVFVTPRMKRKGIARLIMDGLERKAIELYSSLGYRRFPCEERKKWSPWSICFEKWL